MVGWMDASDELGYFGMGGTGNLFKKNYLKCLWGLFK